MSEPNLSSLLWSTADLLRGDYKQSSYRKVQWINEEKTKVGYEEPFNRHLHVWKPPRPFAVIDVELKVVTDRIAQAIQGRSR